MNRRQFFIDRARQRKAAALRNDPLAGNSVPLLQWARKIHLSPGAIKALWASRVPTVERAKRLPPYHWIAHTSCTAAQCDEILHALRNFRAPAGATGQGRHSPTAGNSVHAGAGRKTPRQTPGQAERTHQCDTAKTQNPAGKGQEVAENVAPLGGRPTHPITAPSSTPVDPPVEAATGSSVRGLSETGLSKDSADLIHAGFAGSSQRLGQNAQG